MKISDDLKTSGRIIYALIVMAPDSLPPWELERLVNFSLSISQGDAVSYYREPCSDREQEVAGRIYTALHKCNALVELDDVTNSIIRASLDIDDEQAEKIADILNDYLNLKDYVVRHYYNL